MATYSATRCVCCGGAFDSVHGYDQVRRCGPCRMRCTPNMACTRHPDLTLVLKASVEQVREKKNE